MSVEEPEGLKLDYEFTRLLSTFVASDLVEQVHRELLRKAYLVKMGFGDFEPAEKLAYQVLKQTGFFPEKK